MFCVSLKPTANLTENIVTFYEIYTIILSTCEAPAVKTAYKCYSRDSECDLCPCFQSFVLIK